MKTFWASLSCLVFSFCMLVHAADPGTVLLRNVTLIDRDDGTKDAIVNILIRDGNLDVVTKEEISADEAEISVDAQNFVLLGNLSLGEPPSFVILNEDPRENYEVLLDTKSHVDFAVVAVEVVLNTLPRLVALAPQPEEEPQRSGWLSYNPPPVALPFTYYDSRKWNRFETKPTSGLLTGALILDRQRWLSQDAQNVAQVGNLDDFDGGEIRALRLGLVGSLNFPTPWIYTFFGSANGYDKGFDTEVRDDFSLLDYRLDIPIFEKATLSIGKQKEPISMERLTSLVFLPMQERFAAADAMLPARNLGIVINGTGFNQRMSWATGVFNNWIDSSVSFDENPTQYIGRVTAVPWLSQDESNLFHLGFGARRTDAKLPIQYKTEPEFDQAPVYVDTGSMTANSGWTYDLEASWRRGPFWLAAEYIYTDLDSPEFGNPTFDGYSLTVSWVLSGEMRAYNKGNGTFRPVPISRSVYQGGWGAWELSTRWSTLDLTDGTVEGGETDIFSIGVNWWLSQIFNVNMNYRYIWLDRFGEEGSSSGINIRIMMMLQ